MEFALCCAALCCAVLCCAVLRCAALRCAVGSGSACCGVWRVVCMCGVCRFVYGVWCLVAGSIWSRVCYPSCLFCKSLCLTFASTTTVGTIQTQRHTQLKDDEGAMACDVLYASGNYKHANAWACTCGTVQMQAQQLKDCSTRPGQLGATSAMHLQASSDAHTHQHNHTGRGRGHTHTHRLPTRTQSHT